MTRTTSARTAHAVAWVLAGKLIARLFDFISLIVLARLLTPGDFGLVGMAVTVSLIAEAVFELPIFQALVRIKQITPAMFDTAFTLSALRGLVLGASLAAVSWPMSVFFGDSRLVALICILAIAPIARGLLSPRMVLFTQRLDFRREAALEIASKCVALLVATTAAYLSHSYWALAAATISATVTLNMLSFGLAPYRPRLTLSQWGIFRSMVGWNSISQLLSAANWQMDRLLLGRYVPTSTFGNFSLANDLTSIPIIALATSLARPVMSAFTKVDSPSAYGIAYCKVSNAVLAIVAPVFLVMALLAEPLVRVMLGEKWMAAAPIIWWLSLIAIITLPVNPMNALAMVLDRARAITARTAAEFLLRLPVTCLAVIGFGINGAIWSRGALATFVLVWSMSAVSRLVGAPIKQQLSAVWRTAAALAIAAAIGIGAVAAVPAPREMLQAVAYLGGMACLILGAYLAALLALWRLCGRPPGIEATALGIARPVLARLHGRS